MPAQLEITLFILRSLKLQRSRLNSRRVEAHGAAALQSGDSCHFNPDHLGFMSPNERACRLRCIDHLFLYTTSTTPVHFRNIVLWLARQQKKRGIKSFKGNNVNRKSRETNREGCIKLTKNMTQADQSWPKFFASKVLLEFAVISCGVVHCYLPLMKAVTGVLGVGAGSSSGVAGLGLCSLFMAWSLSLCCRRYSALCWSCTCCSADNSWTQSETQSICLQRNWSCCLGVYSECMTYGPVLGLMSHDLDLKLFHQTPFLCPTLQHHPQKNVNSLILISGKAL